MATRNDSISVEELSDNFLEKKSRTTDENDIKTEVEDVRIYPFDDDWWLRIDCGEPFSDSYLRVNLGSNVNKAIQSILDFYPDTFESITQLTYETVSVNLNVSHSAVTKTKLSDVEIEELEDPAVINGIEGTIGRIPKMNEYQFDNCDEATMIQERIESVVCLYQSIQRRITSEEVVRIDSVSVINERMIEVKITELDGADLSIAVSLPDANSIQNHPVTELISKVGSGKIGDLDSGSVYLYKTSSSEKVVGSDMKFNQFGISPTKIDDTDSSSGFLSRLFNL